MSIYHSSKVRNQSRLSGCDVFPTFRPSLHKGTFDCRLPVLPAVALVLQLCPTHAFCMWCGTPHKGKYLSPLHVIYFGWKNKTVLTLNLDLGISLVCLTLPWECVWVSLLAQDSQSPCPAHTSQQEQSCQLTSAYTIQPHTVCGRTSIGKEMNLGIFFFPIIMANLYILKKLKLLIPIATLLW